MRGGTDEGTSLKLHGIDVRPLVFRDGILQKAPINVRV